MAPQQQSLQIRYTDLPDIRETFADSIHTMVWDGQALRVEFCVTRFADPAGEAEAKRYPACRLVLSAAAAGDLANRLQQTMAALQAGRPAKPAPNADATAAAHPAPRAN